MKPGAKARRIEKPVQRLGALLSRAYSGARVGFVSLHCDSRKAGSTNSELANEGTIGQPNRECG